MEKLKTRVLPPQVHDVLFFKFEKCGMGWVGRKFAVKQKGVKILPFPTMAKKSHLASEPHFLAFNTIDHHSWVRISISMYGPPSTPSPSSETLTQELWVRPEIVTG